MSNKKESEIKKEYLMTFIKSEIIGKCPCCNENVNKNSLYVKEEENIYHFSCYNMKKDNNID